MNATNDPLLYSLGKVTVVTDSTADPDTTKDTVTIRPVGAANADDDVEVDVTKLFTINNKTGQISVKSGANLDYLDLEKYPNIVVVPDPAIPGTVDATGTLAYDVMVTATDPSGSNGTVTITIAVDEVNEAPGISRSDDPAPAGAEDRTEGGQFVVTTPEQVQLDLRGITGAVGFVGLPVFDGGDPEGQNDKITWSLSGADAKRFQIANIRAQNGDGYVEGDDNTPDGELTQAEEDAWEALTDAQRAADIADNPGEAALRWATSNGIGPSFEAMDSADDDNVYLVTVTASDGSASKSQAVSITVTNREEPGSISLTQLLAAGRHSDNCPAERSGRQHNGHGVAVVQGRCHRRHLHPRRRRRRCPYYWYGDSVDVESRWQ